MIFAIVDDDMAGPGTRDDHVSRADESRARPI